LRKTEEFHKATLIEIFLSVYNEFLLIINDLSRRCGWEQRCEPRAVGVPWPTC